MFWKRRLSRSRRSSADRDLDAARELRAHLDQEAEGFRDAGASCEEAEYAAVPITTVAQPMAEVAETATAAVLELAAARPTVPRPTTSRGTRKARSARVRPRPRTR